jgi:hypothetical protein
VQGDLHRSESGVLAVEPEVTVTVSMVSNEAFTT